MLPVLSHIEQYQDLNIWVTTDGVCGIGFRIAPCDIETENVEEFGQRLVQVLRQLDPRILGRIKMEPVWCDELDPKFPRAEAINDLGFQRKDIFLYLDFIGGFHALKEIKKALLKNEAAGDPAQFQALIRTKALFEQYGFKLFPLSEGEIFSLFSRLNSAWVCSDRSVESGSMSVGVIRLLKQPLDLFSETDWVQMIYTVFISLLLAIAPVMIFFSTMLGLSQGVGAYFSSLISLCMWPVLWNLLGLLGRELWPFIGDSPVSTVLFWVVIQILQLFSPLFCVLLFRTLSPSQAISRVISIVG